MKPINPDLLERGRNQYLATMSDANCVVRDSIITPFAFAMRLDGYRGVLSSGGCATLRECPICPVGKSTYSTLYERQGREVWACPICATIDDGA